MLGDIHGDESESKRIVEKWGSEEAVYIFLNNQFQAVNQQVFGGQHTVPNFQVKPMWLSSGPLGERNSGADYEPAEGTRTAEIGIFTKFLRDETTARLVLVHEMIHHWEHTIGSMEDEDANYPASVDGEISTGFPALALERGWRRVHSARFIAKACVVADILKLPMRSLLFGG